MPKWRRRWNKGGRAQSQRSERALHPKEQGLTFFLLILVPAHLSLLLLILACHRSNSSSRTLLWVKHCIERRLPVLELIFKVTSQKLRVKEDLATRAPTQKFR